MFECFTRFSPDLDGHTETVCDRVPIWSAPECGAGGSCGGYTRMDGCRQRNSCLPAAAAALHERARGGGDGGEEQRKEGPLTAV